jgi:hypothetical protein
MRTHKIGDTTLLRDEVEIPGLGVLNVNAFLIHAEQPVLVDTGRPVARAEFLDALRSAIDPSEIRWIWLTHPDRDHMGALMSVLDLAPQARLVTSFTGFGYMSVEFDIPLDRIHLLNPGQALAVGGGRTLHAFRPPLFDSPMTTGFFDDATGICYSSDCFGAPMPSVAEAQVDDLDDIDPAQVVAAQLLWAGADSPWVATADPARFAATYQGLRSFAPDLVLSTHLPPARGCFPRLLDFLDRAPHIEPFVGPDQAALEAMLAGAPS